MYFNSRSLTNKVDLLKNYTNANNPDIIAITETWAKPEIPDGLYAIPGYKIFRHDRSVKRGGGVMMYIKDTIASSQIHFTHCPEFDFLACKVYLSNGNCVGLLCIYRPPSITDTGDLNIINLIDNFLSLNFSYNIISGDFNMPTIDWKFLSAPPKYTAFLKCCMKHYLRQHVKEPTRPNSNAVLDLVLSTTGTTVSNISINECFGLSDHSIVNFNIILPISLCSGELDLHTISRKRNYNKANWDHMSQLLSKADWETIFNSEDVNEVWCNFKKALTYAAEGSIPLKSKKSWRIKSDSKIRSALRYTRRCHKIYKSLKSNNSLLKLIHAKEHLQNLIHEQTISFENHIVESLCENPRQYWSYVRSKITNTRNSIDMIKTPNETIENPSKIAEALSEHFYNCFNHNFKDKIALNSNIDTKMSSDKDRNLHVEVDFHVVKSIIKSLPNKRSEDHDGFSYAILKHGGNILFYQLSRLFKLSLTKGKIPSDWKKSVIFPIKKKVTATTVDDYRPINITSCICRVLERILRRTLERFLEENDLICKTQHGFSKGRSTTTALLTYSNELSASLDHGMCVDSAYFDFSKAFENVRHDYLIEKLSNIGLCGPVLTWIIDYLQKRTQVVNVNGYLSTEKKVSSGVIQGSVLGPIFFLIFVNDVDTCIKNCLILKYADDIRIYRSFKSDINNQTENCILFQDDINALTRWAVKWDLKFNTAKCCILHFGHSNTKALYTLNDIQIANKVVEKDLGILFSSNFKFNKHIDSIVKKANQQLGIIARIFKNKTVQTIVPLYRTFVRPFLEYNSIVWSPYTKKNELKIEKIQKKALKLIYELRHLTYQEQLKRTKLMSLRARRIRHQLIVVFKMKNRTIDLSFEDFFQKCINNKTRGNIFKLRLPKTKTKMRQSFFANSVIKYWNLLKSSEINARTNTSFTKNIKTFFMREKIW
jgi:hypothetical protein